MKRASLALIAVGFLLAFTASPVEAGWYPGKFIVKAAQGVGQFVAGNGADRRRGRRAEGRGLGRVGIGRQGASAGYHVGHNHSYGRGGCAACAVP